MIKLDNDIIIYEFWMELLQLSYLGKNSKSVDKQIENIDLIAVSFIMISSLVKRIDTENSKN